MKTKLISESKGKIELLKELKKRLSKNRFSINDESNCINI